MVNALQSYFHKGTEKQNSSHWINYCKGCVKHEKKLLQDAGTFDAVDWQEGGQSFREGELSFLHLYSIPLYVDSMSTYSVCPRR
jgi:hypothetical protein